MFNTVSDGQDPTIGCVLRRGEFTTKRLFRGSDDDDSGQDESLASQILTETTPSGQGVTCQVRQAFIMRLAFIGLSQEAHATGLIEYEEVFDRVAFLLAAVVA